MLSIANTSFAAPPAFGLTIIIPPRKLLESTSNAAQERNIKTAIIRLNPHIVAIIIMYFAGLQLTPACSAGWRE